VTLPAKVGDEMAADETTGAADENFVHAKKCLG
jgi:hypothetical protein